MVALVAWLKTLVNSETTEWILTLSCWVREISVDKFLNVCGNMGPLMSRYCFRTKPQPLSSEMLPTAVYGIQVIINT